MPMVDMLGPVSDQAKKFKDEMIRWMDKRDRARSKGDEPAEERARVMVDFYKGLLNKEPKP
jgi:hypothetical protein